MEKRKAVILYNKISDNASEDEIDVIEQVKLVKEALINLNFSVNEVEFSIKIDEAINQIRLIKPEVVFNLAETIENQGKFTYLGAAILEYLDVAYTGSPLTPMFVTTNKISAKKEMKRLNIPTAEWFLLNETNLLSHDTKYILKPVWEDGSLGLDEDCVFDGSDYEFIENIKSKNRQNFFIEKFIDGREFNVSILSDNGKPEILPIAEMKFIDFPEEKPKILGYTAKWKEDTFEYGYTQRSFDFNDSDKKLLDEIKEICIKCWNELDLKGYVRVDFRVDKDNNPFVLEINANPCIAQDSGFINAAHKAGYTNTEIILRIVNDAFIA